jgi:dTDP-4-dehydrorhamnose reductase
LTYSPDYVSDANFLRRHCKNVRPIVIVGANSSLGRAFAQACAMRALPFRLLSRRDMDTSSSRSVDAALEKWKPWAVVNAADYALVDEAEQEGDRCFVTNAQGPATLAASCVRHGAKLLIFSSHQVFDGEKGAPYVESDRVSPLNVYGRSKAEAEYRVLDILPQALVVRTASLFNAEEHSNFVAHTLDTLARGETLAVADDEIVTPTYMPDLVHTSLDLLLDEESGRWHLTNAGAWSRADLAQRIAELADLPQDLIERVPSRLLNRPARRPHFSALGSERGWLLPPWGDAVEHCVNQWQMANIAQLEERVSVIAA